MPGRVLIVDDDEGFRYAIAKILTAAGYTTVAAPDYRRALEILEDRQPLALLLMDVVIPGVNGFALARMARMRHLGLKVIYVSAFDDIPTDEAIGPVLRKPIEADTLLEEIHRLLADPPAG